MRKVFTLLAMAFIGLNAFAQNELVEGDFQVGDKITINGQEWLVGPNLIKNPSFDMDPADNGGNIVGWTVGANYAQMTTSNFNWFAKGGHDGGAYIQAAGHTGAGGANSVAMKWDVDSNSRYYFSYWLAKNSANNQYIPVISLTDKESSKGGENEDEKIIGMSGNSSDGCLGYSNFVDEDGDGVGEWCQTGLTFETKEYTFLQYTARWLKENKIQACFDDFHLHKLYDPQTTKPETIAFISLQAAIDEFNNLIADDLSEVYGIQEEASDWMAESGYDDLSEDNTLDEIQNAISVVNSQINIFKGSISNTELFKTLLADAENLINSTQENPYPGLNEFMNKFDSFVEYADDGFYSLDETVPASEYVLVQINNLKTAMNEYRFSQKATEDNPADYTFLVKNPEFIQSGSEPTYDAEGNAIYPNVDNYTSGSAPEDATSDGWYIGVTGGDQRLNYVQGRVCWNAWRSGATDPISISQDIEGLPNGYYSVGAYMITQAGYITDQHVFANGTIDNQKSRTLEKDTWNDDNTGEWDWLETGKILVSDGKLTIGGKGTLNGNAAAGWFCVTHFVLKYYGEAGEDAYQVIYNNTLQKCQDLAAEMGFKADKAAFEEVINANKDAQDKEGYLAALAALNPAYDTAYASQTEYNGEVTGTYAALQDSIANAYPENCKEVAKVIVDLMTAFLASDEATSAEGAQKTPVLRYYRDNLIPALQACETKEYTSETSKAIIADVIKEVTTALTAITEFPTTDELAPYIARLNEVKAVCDAQEEYETKGVQDGDDYTFAIQNPTIEASSNTVVPEGWTIDMSGSGNGYYTNYGQEYNGGSGHYLDAWNGTAALLLYNAYQVLEEIPNGQYKLTAMVRNSSNNGYYLYAEPNCDKEQIVLNPVATQNLNYTKYFDTDAKAEAGGDSISVVTDTYGEIWEAAVNKLAEVKNITGPVKTDDGYYSTVEQIIDAYEGDESLVPEEYLNDYRTIVANSNQGRGWQYKSVEFEVTNHSAIIGVVTDSTFTAGLKDINGSDCVPYDGTWMSADNFTLTIVKVGDNTGWNPAVGIEAVNNEGVALINNRKYNLAGQVVGNNYKGIVIFNGKKYLQR